MKHVGYLLKGLLVLGVACSVVMIWVYLITEYISPFWNEYIKLTAEHIGIFLMILIVSYTIGRTSDDR